MLKIRCFCGDEDLNCGGLAQYEYTQLSVNHTGSSNDIMIIHNKLEKMCHGAFSSVTGGTITGIVCRR
jgi:hypothetical protein